uniref:VWFD domain-containing protein n=1 Tax=Macrostomum lignano TaxID=282301 RepID=A0A1I8JC03_9PLAT
HAAQWQPDTCSHCICRAGQISCRKPDCADQRNGCAPGYELETRPGQCCPQCVEKFGSCSVLGRPLLRTFDASIVHMRERCRYTLVKLCVERYSKFRIRFAYGRRGRALQIAILRNRLSVGAGFKLRLNGRRISLGSIRNGGWLSVATLNGYLQVRLLNGVRIVWDGRSFLEVQAPKSLGGYLCGLCGNYNGRSDDDSLGVNGEMFHSQREFTRAWREGFCRADHRTKSNCLLNGRQRRWARQYCRPLRRLECAGAVNMTPYYK